MGAALDRAHRPRAISLGASMTAIPLNRRLPGTFRRVLGLLARWADEESAKRYDQQNIACGNRVPGSRLLTPYLAFLALERISRDL